jgi:hypothetical protein
MNAIGMHTSALDAENDMFTDTAAAPPVSVSPNQMVVQIVGVLLSAAVVRTKVVGIDHHPLPVLCMEVRPLAMSAGFKQTIHAEQIYTEATRPLADAKAATLKRGVQITLTTTLIDMRTLLPHVQDVALSPEPIR